jgi:WD40 repeat protein
LDEPLVSVTGTARRSEGHPPGKWWWRLRRARADIGFGAFVSYSGQQDRELISKLQNGIEKFAKPWYLPPSVKVFVDKTSIAAGTRLWSRIEFGLSRSYWLILMASPESAQSPWVERELDWWVNNQPIDNIIIVHTAGQLRWDETLNDFSADSTAISPRLRGVFPEEPVWATVPRTEHGANVDAAVLSITAAVRGIPVHELSSQAHREHRRTLRWAGGAIAILAVLLVAALVMSVIALVQKRHADEQARLALSRQLASASASFLSSNPRAALLLSATAYRMNPNAQTLAALMRADTANPNLVRYFGVDGQIAQLGASGDGHTIIAGLADGRVVRWPTDAAAPTAVIKLANSISSLGVSNDASVIAASDGTSLSLWRSGSDAAGLPVVAGQTVKALGVSPSGRTLVVHEGSAVLTRSESDVVFDVASPQQRAAHPFEGDVLYSASDVVVPADDEVVLLGGDGRWQTRHIADWTLKYSGFVGMGAHERAGLPSANGLFFTASNGSPIISVWRTDETDPSQMAPRLSAHAPIQYLGALVLSADGTNVAVENGGSVYVAPVAPLDAQVPVGGPGNGTPASDPGQRGPTTQVPGTGILTTAGLRFFGDNTHLLTAVGNQIARWDLGQVDRLARVVTTSIVTSPCNACSPTSVAVSPDGQRVAMVGAEETAVEPMPGSSAQRLHFAQVGGLPLWRPDGELIIVTDAHTVRDYSSGHGGVRLVSPGGDRIPLAAALTPDKNMVMVVGANGTIYRLDADTGAVRGEIPVPEINDGDSIKDAAISPSGDLAAVVKTVHDIHDNAGALVVYDITGSRVVGTVPGSDISYARFSNGRLLVQRRSGDLEIWDDRGTVKKSVIAGNEGYYEPPVADSEGTLVARRRLDYTIDLYDMQTGALIDTIPALPNTFKSSAVFAPGSQTLVVGVDGYSGNARFVVRDLSAKALLAAACAAAGSNLSAAEWQGLVGDAPVGVQACP